MVRIRLIFLLIMTGITCIFSQTNFGIKAGLNYSTLTENPDIFNPPMEFNDFALRFHSGFFIEHAFNQKVAIRGEVLYSYQGSNPAGSNPVFFTIQELEYVQVPILTRLELLPKWYFEGGISIGFIINNPTKDLGVTLFENKTDISPIIGISFNVSPHFGLNIRYLHGVINVFEINLTDINGNPIGTVGNQNRLFQLSLEFYFNHKND